MVSVIKEFKTAGISSDMLISVCDKEEDGALVAAQSADDLLNILELKLLLYFQKLIIESP